MKKGIGNTTKIKQIGGNKGKWKTNGGLTRAGLCKRAGGLYINNKNIAETRNQTLPKTN